MPQNINCMKLFGIFDCFDLSADKMIVRYEVTLHVNNKYTVKYLHQILED